MKKLKGSVLLLTCVLLMCLCAGAMAAADTSWYTGDKTEYVITTADQLHGLSKLSADGALADGITIKLGQDIDLKGANFEPIDYFCGTFDGQGHTIKNVLIDVHQCSVRNYMGLFREVEDSTIKNLKVDHLRVEPDGCSEHKYTGSSNPAYYVEAAVIAGKTTGDCAFENITLTNCFASAYNNSVGGMASEVFGETTFTNIRIDDTNTLQALWSTPDGVVGGVVGMLQGGAKVHIKDSYIAPVMDVYNDYTANYMWGEYRNTGMLVGCLKNNSDLPNITAENTTVAFGSWNQYVYCEFERNGKPSYGEDGQYKYSRVEPDDVHTHTPVEDGHMVLFAFENLVGLGTGNGKVDIHNVAQEAPGIDVRVIYLSDLKVNGLPNTGDASRPALLAAALLLSVAGLLACARRRTA